MRRRKFLLNSGLIGSAAMLKPFVNIAGAPNDQAALVGLNHRTIWLNYLEKLAGPVLGALANAELKLKMPVEGRDAAQAQNRINFTHLEAFGRLLSGISPWLQADITNEEEKKLQQKYFKLAIKSIGNAVDPQSKDYLNWGDGGGEQPLVDASYVAYAFIRAPKLWNALNETTQKQVLSALKQTHRIRPVTNNWLLFAAMIEAFYIAFNQPFDIMRLDYAIRQHEEWYKGDGFYGDGPEFHWDYYNSYVIHPYLYDILKVVPQVDKTYEEIRKQVYLRNLRYAAIQERLISPEGTYPPIGRSITYRTGAFQHLANMALNNDLPHTLSLAQVRCALTAVIKKVNEAKTMFNNDGWLQIGLYGKQPQLADVYVSTGSLYICSNILLPLGLPETSPFWKDSDEDWTSKKIWNGIDTLADHS